MSQLKVGEWYSLPVNIGDCSNIELDEIEIGLITRAAFLELPQWITQRSVTNRIKKKGVLDHLAKLFPTHFIVALAELTEDDVWEDGREFDKGSEWTIDANSRAYVWRNQMSDNLPDHVLAVKYKGKTLRDIRSIYWAFDNPTAAEVAAEVVTGVLKSLNTTLYTKKFQDGQFVTALSYTCMFDNATVYGDRGLWTDSDDDSITNSEYKRRMTSLAVQQYLPTIKAVDNLLHECGMSKDFDQTFITSLFLFHLKMGVFDKNVVELMKLLAETLLDEDGEKVGIATTKTGALPPQGWIKRENDKGYEKINDLKIPDRGKIDGYYQGVPFFCYWLYIASENGLKTKQKSGPKQGYRKWFDDTFMTRTNMRAILEQTVSKAS